MQFRPCIDLHDGKVKQIIGSSLTDDKEDVVENFVSDYTPSHYAALFKEKQLTGGHVIMLGPGNETAAAEALQTYPDGMQVGGGINAENAKHYLLNGASHVIVTSYIFHDGKLNMENLIKISETVGRDKLVIDLSCKYADGKWVVATDRWTKLSSFEVSRESILMLEEYCSEFLIHAVDAEGKRGGIQEDLVAHLAEIVSIPATYAGGISSLKDIEVFRRLSKGKLDFTIGSALDIFGGDVAIADVIQTVKQSDH